MGKDPDSDGSAQGGADRAGRRRALVLIGGGSAVFACALAVPAVRVLVAPVRIGGGQAKWVRTVRLDSLREGEPRKVAIVADDHDAWTVARGVELGAVWLVRGGGVGGGSGADALSAFS